MVATFMARSGRRMVERPAQAGRVDAFRPSVDRLPGDWPEHFYAPSVRHGEVIGNNQTRLAQAHEGLTCVKNPIE